MQQVRIDWCAQSGVTVSEHREWVPDMELGDQVTYDELRAFIGGPIEFITAGPYEGYVHEEGKLLGLPVNITATARYCAYNGPIDVLAGPVVWLSRAGTAVGAGG